MRRILVWAGLMLAMLAQSAYAAAEAGATEEPAALGARLAVGDLVFIRVPVKPFLKVAETTKSWTNHVGVVVAVSGEAPTIAESTLPFSRKSSWPDFVGRSEQGRVAISRLGDGLDAQQQDRLRAAAEARYGVHYDTGFDLYSHGQFCSRFAREVLDEATGVPLGRIESFADLLAGNPQADISFWRAWYFGNIPWQRQTVTPASLLEDGRLKIIFDGRAVQKESHKGERS